MQPNKIKTLKIVFLAVSILFAFSIGFISGNIFDKQLFSPISESRQRGINENQLMSLNQVWDVIHNQFITQPIDDTALIQGAIRGMMESLGDPYSAYMTPEEFRSQNAPIKGEYTGIGAYVDTTGEFLIIVSPMPGSPAELAGLKAGDRVVAIDGEDMTKVKPNMVLERIFGPAGSKIKVSIQREGTAEILHFEMERAVINIPSVESEMLEGNIGLIRLYTFGGNSTKEFSKALEGLLDQKPIGLIIDLRNNSGGLVDTSIEITSLFIPDGIVMIEEWGDGSRKEYQASGNSVNTEIPLVVLVNEGSASASEITAGALQDHGRAKLVGTPTFGKGFIQNWVPLRNNNGGLRITIARWLTPKGRQIQELGLTPDFLVQFTEEDFQNNFDAQLDQAIMVLNQINNF
jgi:carboxyl-terminal processing protease